MIKIVHQKKGWESKFFIFGLTLLTLFNVNGLFGQTNTQNQFTVSGVVTSTSGDAIPGVNIIEKGTSNGTISTFDGEFTINISGSESILVFSYIGYETQEVNVSGRSSINISMVEQLTSLSEVVVVGYGTQKKSDVSGSISSVGSEELSAYPSLNPIQALQGRAAGVSIQSTNGEPGSGFKIRIRGATSINASSNPLIVVDGLVGGVQPPSEDVASIEILKDASASAIYGSRAANGVVIITTKSGKSGKMRVDFNSSYSVQSEIGRLDLLGAQDFANYYTEATGLTLSNNVADTDWQDLIYRDGFISNNQVSVSGGSDNVRYYVSGVYYNQEGIIDTSNFKRYSLNSKIDIDLSDKINIGINTYIGKKQQDGVLSQQSSAALSPGVVTAAYRFEPTQGVLDENGVYTVSEVGIAAFDNPRGVIDGRTIDNTGEDTQINLRGSWEIIDGLTWNSTFGYSNSQTTNRRFDNRNSNAGISSNGSAQLVSINEKNLIVEHYLNYDLPLGESHSAEFTGGYSYQKFTDQFFTAGSEGFISDALSFWNLGAGSFPQTPTSGISERELSSYYGRLNYNFEDKYFLTLSGRYDGASQFSEGNKWSFFPAIAGSWNITNEDFLSSSNTFKTIKLRASYGQTGNQAIGAYASLAGVTPVFFASNGVALNAVVPTAIANKDLTWETTTQTNIGLDVEILKGKIGFTTDYYIKNTDDLLFNVPIPGFSGFSSRLDNIGEIENKGFEFSLNTVNLDGDLKWTSNFNISANKNKVISLPGSEDIIYSGAPNSIINGFLATSILSEGQPVGSFYGYTYLGVYNSGDTFIPGGGFEEFLGGEKFADLNGDGVLNSDDRSVIGDPNPDFIWGLNNDFKYKNFDLNIFIQGSQGGDVLNLTNLELNVLNGIANATTDALNRWTPSNTNTNVPIAFGDRINRTSTRYIEDGSYTRLKNITLGYTIPDSALESLGVDKLRLYISGQNLITITNYSGIDPEVSYRSSSLNSGLDYGSYPTTTSVTFGVNVSF